jgi:c-di-GMP-binding flagellar brake protein YcgR
MKFALLSAVMTAILLSCGSVKETSTNEELNYTIESLNIEENGFAGNIVVEVYDNEGAPVSDYQSILRNNDEVVFDVPQQNYQCTFFKDGKSLTIEIRKEGYVKFISQPFNTEEEMDNAQFLKITLEKE